MAEYNGRYYYKIDVMGRNGYSFMVKSKDAFEDVYDVIDKALDYNLFNEVEDADYAEIDDLVSMFDIEHFEKCGCIHEI